MRRPFASGLFGSRPLASRPFASHPFASRPFGPARFGVAGLRGRLLRAFALVGCVGVLLSACAEPEAILRGKRIDVLQPIALDAVSINAREEGAGLPPVFNINSAAMQGYTAGHAGGNARLELPLKRGWRRRIVGGATSLTELAIPVIGGGRAFAVSPKGQVAAVDVKNGRRLWSVTIEDIFDEPIPGIGGGLAFSSRAGLVVHAGGRNLALLDPEDGSVLWSLRNRVPYRGAPVLVGNDRVAVGDLDGNLAMISINSGETDWVHFGIAANTVLFGGAAPAYANGRIIIAGAAGEVTYFDADTGELLWTDSVAALQPRTPIQTIGDVRATPVHDGGLIFVVSQSGRFVAFSARNGLPVWERNIAGIEMPWVSGKTVYVVSVDGRLYALRREDGAVRWVVDLPGAIPVDAFLTSNPPRYVGPVVAADLVYVIRRNGRVYSFDPDTGEAVGSFNARTSVSTPPQVATGRMFVLGENGLLTAFE